MSGTLFRLAARKGLILRRRGMYFGRRVIASL
jgi:hypothetical protein